MLEFICLCLLAEKIVDRARRAGRSPKPSILRLLFCWFAGEAAGFAVGYFCFSGEGNIPLIYGLALAGAACGGRIALVKAKSLGPVDGVWRELPPFRSSRLLGALLGGGTGALLGAVVVVFMTMLGHTGKTAFGAFLPTTAIGALFGLISGFQWREAVNPAMAQPRVMMQSTTPQKMPMTPQTATIAFRLGRCLANLGVTRWFSPSPHK